MPLTGDAASDRDVLSSLSVTLNGREARFSTAVDPRSGNIHVAGIVRDGKPFLAEIGNVDVDVALEVLTPNPQIRTRAPLTQAPAVLSHTPGPRSDRPWISVSFSVYISVVSMHVCWDAPTSLLLHCFIESCACG